MGSEADQAGGAVSGRWVEVASSSGSVAVTAAKQINASPRQVQKP